LISDTAVLTPRRLQLQVLGPSSDAATLVYRPLRATARALARPPLSRIATVAPEPPFDTSALVGWLGIEADGVAVMRSAAPDRHIVGISRGRSLIAVAKVGAGIDVGLENEASVLGRVGASATFAPASVLRTGRWGDRFVVSTEAFDVASAEHRTPSQSRWISSSATPPSSTAT
jgi:hypothetical protein